MLSLVTGATAPILRQKTKRVVDPHSSEIKALMSQMVETMRKEKGVGLAAPQIGKSVRLAVAEADNKIYYLINPEITAFSQVKIVFEEGCLSLPGEFYPIIRSETINVKFQNEKGLPKKIQAKGFLAIVIQHEVDHLDGILICNRYKKQKKKLKSIIKNYGGLA